MYTLYTLHSARCTTLTIQYTHDALHSHYTHPTLHHTPYTIHRTPYTVHHSPYTVHRKLHASLQVLRYDVMNRTTDSKWVVAGSVRPGKEGGITKGGVQWGVQGGVQGGVQRGVPAVEAEREDEAWTAAGGSGLWTADSLAGAARLMSYQLNGLQPGSGYTVAVRACNQHGCGNQSDSVPASTLSKGRPDAPGVAMLTEATMTSLTIR
jgi:hypothetical protein